MVVLLTLSVSGCLGQTATPIFIGYFPPELKQYLALSDDQVTKISTLNTQLNAFRATKVERQIQVQSEIVEWTAKENLDSLALGLRYAELEAIRRELNDRQKKTVSDIQALLNTDQKAKLAVLQQVLTLYSTACSGVSQNLLNPVPVLDRWFDTTSSGACYFIPTAAVRRGDFSATQP